MNPETLLRKTWQCTVKRNPPHARGMQDGSEGEYRSWETEEDGEKQKGFLGQKAENN